MKNTDKSILRSGSGSGSGNGKGRGKNTNPQFRQTGYRPEMVYQPQAPPPEYYYHTQQSPYPPEYYYHTQQDINEGFEAFQPPSYCDREEETDDDDSVTETGEE